MKVKVGYTIRVREEQPHMLRPITWQYGHRHTGEVTISDNGQIATIRLKDKRRGVARRGVLYLLHQSMNHLHDKNASDGFMLTRKSKSRAVWTCREGWLRFARGTYQFELKTTEWDGHIGVGHDAWIEGRILEMSA